MRSGIREHSPRSEVWDEGQGSIKPIYEDRTHSTGAIPQGPILISSWELRFPTNDGEKDTNICSMTVIQQK